MQSRSFTILAAVTVVAVVAAGAVSLNGTTATGAAVIAPTILLPGFAGQQAKVAQIKIQRGSATTVLARDGARWVIPGRDRYPADADRVNRMIDQIAGLTTIEVKTKQPELLSRLDLADVTVPDSKARRIEFDDADGKPLAAVVLGRERFAQTDADPTGIYVRRADENQAWLARGLVQVATDELGWTDNKLPEVDPTTVRQIALFEPGTPLSGMTAAGLTVTATRPDASHPFEPAKAGDGRIYDQTKLTTIASALQTALFADVKSVASFGTLPEPVATLSLSTADGLVVTIDSYEIGASNAGGTPTVGNTWLAVRATGTGDAKAKADAIASRTTGWLYQADSYRLDRFRPKADDLFEKPSAS
ncbi:MAG: DUF4340 domain-containing protein [Azospirillaceae bacterium]|nr:DUF4340 domain-containing protein [Azospirillaceae bacterium]